MHPTTLVPKAPAVVRFEDRKPLDVEGDDAPPTPTPVVGARPTAFLAGWQAPSSTATREPQVVEISREQFEENVGQPTVSSDEPTTPPTAEPDRLATIPEEDEENVSTTASTGGDEQDPLTAAAAYCLLATDCPTTYKLARVDKDKDKWRAAMDEELEKMNRYEVWEAVPRTCGCHVSAGCSRGK